MGTRSRIGKVQADGTVLSIYCHWDGYLEGVGAMLIENYQDEAKIDTLLSLGDMSSLYEDIGEQHDFNARTDNVCTFYGRDRGDTDIDAESDPDEATFWSQRNRSGAEFLYLRKDGAWWVQETYPKDSKPVLLSAELKSHY